MSTVFFCMVGGMVNGLILAKTNAKLPRKAKLNYDKYYFFLFIFKKLFIDSICKSKIKICDSLKGLSTNNTF